MSIRNLFAVICLSSSLAFVFAPEAVAQGDLQEFLDRLEARDGEIEALNSREFTLDEPGRDAAGLQLECADIFTADNQFRDGDPHFEIGHRFIITGPLPFSNFFQVTALPSVGGDPHGWAGAPNHYFAEPTLTAGLYKLNEVMVTPHGGMPEREHRYWMHVFFEGPCPDYVIFEFVEHVPPGGDRDPGHGSAGR